MATHRIPIINWATVPDENGRVYFEPFVVKATNGVWNRMVLVFNQGSARDAVRGGFAVPKNYVGSAKIICVYTSSVLHATNGMRLEFDYRAVGGNDAESLDETDEQEAVATVGVNSSAPSAVNERMEDSITLTASNLAVDDEVEFEFFRDGLDPNDNHSGPLIVFNLLFEYADA